MRYFNIIWLPFACLLSIAFFIYFMGQHFKFWLQGRLWLWRNRKVIYY